MEAPQESRMLDECEHAVERIDQKSQGGELTIDQHVKGNMYPGLFQIQDR
jgi:hypothetical protein